MKYASKYEIIVSTVSCVCVTFLRWKNFHLRNRTTHTIKTSTPFNVEWIVVRYYQVYTLTGIRYLDFRQMNISNNGINLLDHFISNIFIQYKLENECHKKFGASISINMEVITGYAICRKTRDHTYPHYS